MVVMTVTTTTTTTGGWEEAASAPGHVALTSRTWSSVAGSTSTCRPWLWLNTCPGLKGSRRGMGRPRCCWSPLPTDRTLPRLRMLAVSAWSSRALSSRERVSFSTQLSGDDRERSFQNVRDIHVDASDLF